MVTIRITRSNGVFPAASRKIVCSGDRLLNVNERSKPLAPSVLLLTVTPVSASITTCGIGRGTTGPTSNVR